MDNKLRQLERQALTDPEARFKLVAEMQRLGYQEKEENVRNGIYLSCTAYSPEEFMNQIQGFIKPKHREKYHRFTLYFSGSSNCNYDSYDGSHYCDESPTVSVSICGIRLETEKELKQRTKQETAREKAIKQQHHADTARRKKEKEDRDNSERRTYERLKRRFESEDKIEQLLASIGEAAEASLREYSPGYFKSWFHRKFKKLEGKTPMQVFDEGDTDKLRLFALKAL